MGGTLDIRGGKARRFGQTGEVVADGIRDFDALLMASPAVLYSARLDGVSGATYVSPNITKVLGYTPDELQGDPDWWSDHLPPDERDAVIANMEQAMVGADHLAHEYRIKHKQGHYIWVHDELNIFRAESDGVIDLVGSWLDITDKVEARRLAYSHAALDNVAFGVISLDENLEIQTINRWAREIVEAKDGISVGSDNRCRLDRSDDDQTFQQTVLAMVKGQNRNGVAMRVARPSHQRPYAAMIVPVLLSDFYAGDESRRCLVFIQDPSAVRHPSPTIIGNMYGLTPSESRLVANLIAGGILKEAAEKVGIAEGSARTYLKNVFQKTGARNQMELVRMILLGPSTFWWRDD